MYHDPKPVEILPALGYWLLVFGSSVGLVLLVSLLFSLIAKGTAGPGAVLRHVLDAFRELSQLSFRRIWALALLTIKESWRRKALMVFVLFAILFMFGGWFLSNANARAELQVEVYVSFVLKAISFLVIPVVLLLSCWGIPEDIKSRTLHTVVTKPARRLEIVIGRMLGFSSIATLVLVIMGVVGWGWIKRQVPEKAQPMLTCRVPVFGSLSFKDRDGNPVKKGINVGDIWDYRGFIHGATNARAIYEFENVTPDLMVPVPTKDGSRMQLKLESSFESFRTHMGEMGTGLLCQLEFVNEAKNLRFKPKAFYVKEFTSGNITNISRKIPFYDDLTKETRIVDLFDDLVHDVDRQEQDEDGNEIRVQKSNVLRVEVQCVDPEQLLGMARPDLFIRIPDQPFEVGYSKAMFGIWLMLLLIIMLGVTASCFANGPVSSLLTVTLVVVGLGFHDFLERLVQGEVKGGGAVESVVRIFQHLNPQVRMNESIGTTIMRVPDAVASGGLWMVHKIVPNFNTYSMSEYVANGFDVPWNAALLPSLLTTIAYFLPCLLLGYYSLKLRELEAK